LNFIFKKELKPRYNDTITSYAIDNSDSTIKRYNVSVGTDVPDNQASMTPPVILYTDAHNRREEKCLVEEDTVQPRGRVVSQASKGARLSKYNFLSEAFSQMRSSYGGISQQTNYTTTNSNDNRFEDQPISMVAAPQPIQKSDRFYRDSMVLPYNRDISADMYSIPTDANRTSPPSPPIHTREPTAALGSLHPSRQVQNLPRLVTRTFDRESVKSDEVSKYSTSPTSPTTTTTTTTANKPYPYF
jgi:hypothetical protein